MAVGADQPRLVIELELDSGHIVIWFEAGSADSWRLLQAWTERPDLVGPLKHAVWKVLDDLDEADRGQAA